MTTGRQVQRWFCLAFAVMLLFLAPLSRALGEEVYFIAPKLSSDADPNDPEHPEDDRTFTLEQMRVAYGVDEDTLIADPGFRDPDHFDFTLSPDSFAVRLGFVPIDTSDVGPRVRF